MPRNNLLSSQSVTWIYSASEEYKIELKVLCSCSKWIFQFQLLFLGVRYSNITNAVSPCHRFIIVMYLFCFLFSLIGNSQPQGTVPWAFSQGSDVAIIVVESGLSPKMTQQSLFILQPSLVTRLVWPTSFVKLINLVQVSHSREKPLTRTVPVEIYIFVVLINYIYLLM